MNRFRINVFDREGNSLCGFSALTEVEAEGIKKELKKQGFDCEVEEL
jgi:hypothetical protein